tara:strand:+ start:2292 stop:2489 length:198 start_codon:yes stop_codon:yes gene_type:complete
MMFGAMASTEGPTGIHEKQYDIILAEHQGVAKQVSQFVDVDLSALNAKLECRRCPLDTGLKNSRD